MSEVPTVRYSHPWDWIEMVLCRTVGCRSWLSLLGSPWPVRYVCTPYMEWRYRVDKRKEQQ